MLSKWQLKLQSNNIFVEQIGDISAISMGKLKWKIKIILMSQLLKNTVNLMLQNNYAF